MIFPFICKCKVHLRQWSQYVPQAGELLVGTWESEAWLQSLSSVCDYVQVTSHPRSQCSHQLYHTRRRWRGREYVPSAANWKCLPEPKRKHNE